MARLFDDASSEYLEINSAVISGYPFSVSVWFYTDTTSIKETLFWIGDKDAGDEYFEIQLLGNTAGDPITATARCGGNENHATTTAGFSANAWHHTAGVFTDATSRAALIDGANKGTDSTSCTPSGLDRTAIGRSADSSPSDYMSGRIGEVAVWDVALSDDEVAALAAGASPLTVRPGNLVAYWWLIRDEDQDVVGGYDLTAYNTPSIATHPPEVFGRAPALATGVPAAAAPANALPMAMHQYRLRRAA